MKEDFIFDDDMINNIQEKIEADYYNSCAFTLVSNILEYVALQGLAADESMELILALLHGWIDEKDIRPFFEPYIEKEEAAYVF